MSITAFRSIRRQREEEAAKIAEIAAREEQRRQRLRRGGIGALKIGLLEEKEPRGSGYKYFEFFRDYYDAENIKGKNLEEFDLVVVRGSESLAYKVPLNQNISYLLISHDVASMRSNTLASHEREMVENAVAMIRVTEDHLGYFAGRGYKVPPCEVIYLRPLNKDFKFKPLKKLKGKHLVYAGGVTSKKENHYRSYYTIFEAFIAAGWTVHIYCYNKGLEEYSELGCKIHNVLSYPALLREMSQYTAGLAGYHQGKDFKYTQTARQNKCFDYLAAGIPTIAVNPGNQRKIYEGKWGVVVEDLSEKTLANINLPRITSKMRVEQVMDKDKHKFDQLLKVAVETIIEQTTKGKN